VCWSTWTGTTPAYFQRFLYGDRQPLALAQGRAFSGDLPGLYEVVLGAEVAERLGYRLGDKLTLSHGGGGMPGAEHDDKPFGVVGILQRTGTPVDRTLHISLQAMEAIHLDWVAGVPLPGQRTSAEQARAADLEPKQVTAALLGLKNRAAVFAVQRGFSSPRLVASICDSPAPSSTSIRFTASARRCPSAMLYSRLPRSSQLPSMRIFESFLSTMYFACACTRPLYSSFTTLESKSK